MKKRVLFNILAGYVIIGFCMSSVCFADYFSERGRTQDLRQRELNKRWHYMEKGNPSQEKAPEIDMGGKDSWDRYQGTWNLSGNLGYSTFYFSNVNSYINDVNDELTGQSVDALTAINGGMSGGLSLAYWINHRGILGFSFRYLNAHSIRETSGISDELKLSVTEYNLLLKLGRGLSPNFVFFVAIEPGFIQYSDASVSSNREALGGGAVTVPLSDTQYGLKITTALDYKIKADIAIGVELGYRTYGHMKFDVDYTGFFAEAGVRLYLK